MNNLISNCIAFLFFLSCIPASAQESGLKFTKGSWNEIIELAKAEDKMIFLDAYTTWCAPCKKMDKETFPSKKAGTFFNENFINVKLDMEKGEGPEIASQYGVTVYPTFLFLSSAGSIIHRNAGFFNVNEFIELGRVAMDPSRSLVAMDKQFMDGNRNPDFLYKYTMARFYVRDNSHMKAADAYMATQDNWSTNESLDFVFNYLVDTDSKMFDHLVQNKDLYYTRFGQQNVSGKIQQLIYNKIYDSKEESSLEQIRKLYVRAYGPERGEKMASHFRLTFYRQAGDRENYALSAIDYYKKFPSNDPEELNETAWTFYNVIEDKKQLKKAVKWAKQSIALDNNYYNNDTLAALLFKLGKKKKALLAAETAINIAKQTGDDFTQTKALVNKIQSL